MVYFMNIAYLRVQCVPTFMSTKLIKLDVPDALHRRIKTLAAHHEKKISDYVVEVLEEHVPKIIVFADEEKTEKKPRPPS
jgi:hypothetical protein